MAAGDGHAVAGLEEALKPFKERASDAETRIAKLEALLLNKGKFKYDLRGASVHFPSIQVIQILKHAKSGSETSSSALKDLQSKLDAVNAECLVEKEKNKKLIMENEKLQYRITHLIRAIKETDSR